MQFKQVLGPSGRVGTSNLGRWFDKERIRTHPAGGHHGLGSSSLTSSSSSSSSSTSGTTTSMTTSTHTATILEWGVPGTQAKNCSYEVNGDVLEIMACTLFWCSPSLTQPKFVFCNGSSASFNAIRTFVNWFFNCTANVGQNWILNYCIRFGVETCSTWFNLFVCDLEGRFWGHPDQQFDRHILHSVHHQLHQRNGDQQHHWDRHQ